MKETPDFEAPDLAVLCAKLAHFNPEFREPVSDRARQYIDENLPLKDATKISSRARIERLGQCFRHRLMAVVSQLEQNPVWLNRLEKTERGDMAEKRVAATEAEFTAAQACIQKTLQKVLTSPTERLDLTRSERHFPHAIIIDPTRITDRMLESLGLSQFIPPAKCTYNERVGYYAMAIPAMHEMLDALEPLGESDSQAKFKRFRLLRIGKGPYEGYVLGTQKSDHEVSFFRTDIHGAYRRITHIREGYQLEIDELIRIMDTISNISAQIVRRWSEVKNNGELVIFKKQLLRIVQELQHVRNKHKVAIKEKIERSLNFSTTRKLKRKVGKDKDGNTVETRPEKTFEVDNPGAISARFTTIRRFVLNRHHESMSVMSELSRDQLMLRALIAAHELPFDRFYQTVEDMHRELVLLHEDMPIPPAVKARIIGNLRVLKEQTKAKKSRNLGKEINMEPYMSFGQKMAEHIDETIAELEKKEVNREATAEAFLKIYLVTKIHYLFQSLQKFYDEFLSGKRIPDFSRMHASMTNINKIFGGKRIDDKIRGHEIYTPEYNAIYGELYHLINSILSRIRRIQKALTGENPNTELAEKLTSEMRERLHDFKFEELLNVDRK